MKKAIFSTSSKSSNAKAAYESVIRYLSRRDHSIKELSQKLSRRYTREAAEAAIQRADELKFIRSEEFLTKQVSEIFHRRAKGIHFIQAELKKRGLPSIEVDADLEISKCKDLLIKKFGETCSFNLRDRSADAKLKNAKAQRFLSYRGFDFETIQKTLNTWNEKK
jgi:regulatory protein